MSTPIPTELASLAARVTANADTIVVQIKTGAKPYQDIPNSVHSIRYGAENQSVTIDETPYADIDALWSVLWDDVTRYVDGLPRKPAVIQLRVLLLAGGRKGTAIDQIAFATRLSSQNAGQNPAETLANAHAGLLAPLAEAMHTVGTGFDAMVGKGVERLQQTADVQDLYIGKRIDQMNSMESGIGELARGKGQLFSALAMGVPTVMSSGAKFMDMGTSYMGMRLQLAMKRAANDFIEEFGIEAWERDLRAKARE